MSPFWQGFEKTAVSGHYLRRAVVGNPTSATLSAKPEHKADANFHADSHKKYRQAQGRLVGAGTLGAAGALVGHSAGKAVAEMAAEELAHHKTYRKEIIGDGINLARKHGKILGTAAGLAGGVGAGVMAGHLVGKAVGTFGPKATAIHKKYDEKG